MKWQGAGRTHVTEPHGRQTFQGGIPKIYHPMTGLAVPKQVKCHFYFDASLYDDSIPYTKGSAINFIKQVKTPSLIVVGDRDEECPAPKSFEYWHALRMLAGATQLVVHPNEGASICRFETRA